MLLEKINEYDVELRKALEDLQKARDEIVELRRDLADRSARLSVSEQLCGDLRSYMLSER